MITCKNCEQLFISCSVEIRGQILHTKTKEENIITISPEYYTLVDNVGESVLGCACGEFEPLFTCDYCDRFIRAETVNVIKRRKEGRMLVCNNCLENMPGIEEQEEVKISDFTFHIVDDDIRG